MQDNHTLHEFASPSLCYDLVAQGFRPTASFFWQRINNQGDVRLNSYLFDIDDYYKDADKLFEETNLKKLRAFSAFAIRDMERYLPDYCICRTNNKYEISLDQAYDIPEISGERLPDVFAKMVLACIAKKVIDLKLFVYATE